MTLRSVARTVLVLIVAGGCGPSGCDLPPSETNQPEPPRAVQEPLPSPPREPLATINAAVILMPGILGSWTRDPSLIEKNAYVRDFTEWVLRNMPSVTSPPTSSVTSDNGLNRHGYREGKELFEAPYDWRRPVSEHDAIMAWIDGEKV